MIFRSTGKNACMVNRKNTVLYSLERSHRPFKQIAMTARQTMKQSMNDYQLNKQMVQTFERTAQTISQVIGS